MHDVTIIGGGIGGLTAAIALQRLGLDVHVYEAAPELRPVGAGIWVPPNAMHVLDRLGLAQAVVVAGLPLDRMEVRDRRAGVLSSVDGVALRARWGYQSVAIRRSELQRVLASALREGTLHTGHRLVSLTQDRAGTRAIFGHGVEVQGRLLVGADGLASRVRERVLPEARRRYSGHSCHRALAAFELPEGMSATAWEVWGGTARFGFSGVGGGEVYWFAPFTAPPGGSDGDAILAELSVRYRAFPEPIPSLVAATSPASIIRTDLSDLAPLVRWHDGRVGLIGDAAHATTPNLGQGGAQAMEDALCLGNRIAEHGPVPAAFAGLERVRLERTRRITRLSRSFGRIAHVEHRGLQRVRNVTLRSMPARVRERQMEELFTARV